MSLRSSGNSVSSIASMSGSSTGSGGGGGSTNISNHHHSVGPGSSIPASGGGTAPVSGTMNRAALTRSQLPRNIARSKGQGSKKSLVGSGSSGGTASSTAASQENRISNGHQHYVSAANVYLQLDVSSIVLLQRIGHELGRGSYSVVFNAVNIDTGDFYAMKRFAFNGKKMDIESLDSIEVSSFCCLFKSAV
jgi:hypothetical protein